MKKSIDGKKLVVKVRIFPEQLAIAKAIAAARTAEDDENGVTPTEPWTVQQILESALEGGLISQEQEWLLTSSLDANAGEAIREEYPASTPVMLALVRAVSQ